jgi:Fe2+ transport system protein FeoA
MVCKLSGISNSSSFRVVLLDLEQGIQSRLLGMGLRLNTVLRVIGKLQRKIIVLIADDIRLVLDEAIASKIFVQQSGE